MKAMFPAAALIVSSIIPALGRHLMNPAILSSNRNLHSVCNALKITFVDNTSTFVAKCNVAPPPPTPPPDLYEDHLHPSRKGMLATSNILELNSLCSKLTVTTHTCTPVVRFDIILISRPTSNNLKDQLILTVDKRLLPLILRFSPLVDSLPPIYPYTTVLQMTTEVVFSFA